MPSQEWVRQAQLEGNKPKSWTNKWNAGAAGGKNGPPSWTGGGKWAPHEQGPMPPGTNAGGKGSSGKWGKDNYNRHRDMFEQNGAGAGGKKGDGSEDRFTTAALRNGYYHSEWVPRDRLNTSSKGYGGGKGSSYHGADTDGAGAVPGTTVRLLGADSALPWVPQLNSGHEASYPTLQEGMAMLEEWVGKFPSCVRKEQVGESFEKRPLWVFKIACYEGVEEKEKGVVGETRHLAVGETQAGEGTTQSSQGDGVEAVLPKVGVDDEQRPSAPLEDTLPTAKRRTATAAPPTTKRPRFLLTSLTHSREPAGLVVVLYYIGNLLFNKAKNDPDAAYILNAREIYAFPFVNPDGYVFNEHSRTRMKRKNMRPSCPRNVEDGGVDLNRNFPTAWKKIRNGCSEEYSGTHAFSEPETIAIKELVEKVKFTVCANLHAYGSMLTHPYNYKKRNTLPKDDTAIYTEINKVFKYSKFGTAQQTVGYTAFGESDDWLYDQGIISMSPEVGHEEDGFWPRKGKIMGIVERNYLRMRYLTLKAGCELEVTSIPSPSTPFAVEIYNRGLVDCASPTIAITFSEPIPTAYFKVGSLPSTTIQAWCAQEKSFAGLPCQCRTQPVERSETSFQDAAKFDLCNAVAVKSPDGVDRGP
eukprot:g12088.t1